MARADPVVRYELAAAEVVRLAEAVRAEQLSDPANCRDWVVRDLLDHLVGGARKVTGIADGWTIDRLITFTFEGLAGDRPVEALREATGAAAAAWRVPGRLEAEYPTAIGPQSGTDTVAMYTVELVVHGWDLARSTGQTTEFDAELVASVDDYVRRVLPPDRPADWPFAAPVEPLAGASRLDRLAAYTGRSA